MIEPQQIITLKDLNKNLVTVQEALIQGETKVLFDRNEPKAVLVGMATYRELTGGKPLTQKALPYHPDNDFN